VRNRLINLIFIVVILIIVSCDGYSGMDGIVIDSQTGEAIAGVKITTVSKYEKIEVETDSSGIFFTMHDYSCLLDCDDSFSIKFRKEGYLNLELNENYLSDDNFIIPEDGSFHYYKVYVEMTLE
jgi:hypothetical protein